MHLCMDEVRAIITAVTEVPTAITIFWAWVKVWWKRLVTACRRCPERCPAKPTGPVVEVISSGPPDSTLSEILRNPPKLELE
jgi:hypothetical protein